MRRRCFVIGITASSASSALARPGLARFEAVEPHLGTLVGITLYARGVEEARAAFAAGYARIRALDAMLSDYRPGSALNAISTEPRRVPPELYRLLAFAQRVARQTGGAFDVTAGGLIRHWRRTRALPLPAIPYGYQHLHLEHGRAWVDDARIRLDVGGLGKGFIADEVLAVLRRAGCGRALIAASGDIVCGDPPPGEPGWRVAAAGETFTVRHTAISTAGDREQYTLIGGRRYSHILDPRTRQPLETAREVTVIARNGLTADALDTALCITGDRRLLEHYPGARALFR